MSAGDLDDVTAYPGAIQVTVDRQVEMRDGLCLSTDVYLPRPSGEP